jgi:hydrogenase expression/formation protein HypC
MHLQDGLPMGKVDFGGISKEVCLAYTPEAQVGDYVLIHVGFAISRIDEAEAEEIFSYLQEIDEASEAGEQRAGDKDQGTELSALPRPSPKT